MKWERLGLLYAPSGERSPALETHAANPLPVRLQGSVYRVFYNGRDAGSRSSIGAVDIDLAERRVLADHFAPCFRPGPAGSFYEAGLSIGNVYSIGAESFMLFMGWQRPASGHWRGDIGRLRLGADLSLSEADAGPLLGPDPVDPISLSYPWVETTPDGYEMYYSSVHAWDAGNGEMLAPIHRATSSDGVSWTRHGPCVPHRLGEAQAFSRPTVARVPDGSLAMWFSYRGSLETGYRIGCARRRADGEWELAPPEAGLEVSESGWDSESVEYPFVLRHEEQLYMLYNGNGYGRTGFGLAVLRP